MSYQVLARKWRPRLFREMVGQEHVLTALINALDHDRLHHAYLFTGTRGVGKTTIARILAKCLNCEVGVSSEPCDQCSACKEINEGRFVDLIEVDAASRTKVEDTRDLLENVQYAPSRGRYKVYLIDEVHMLSNSSFNALLKTLEEPPPHVKFLLATTDPQKLPVTVLSRCLQFNLKNMSAERIVGHLQDILEKEMVPFEEAGLWQLGRAADGSMRDALSLTDQAISFSNGKVTDADVRSMLGTIDHTLVQDVLSALLKEEPKAMLDAIAHMAEHAPDYSAVLAELIACLHRVAIAQVVPEAIDNSLGDRQQIYEFAQSMAPEDVQLYYQTALLGRRDLYLSPDPRSGFEMVMLRMLAFKPQGLAELPARPLAGATATSTPTAEAEAASTVKKSEPSPAISPESVMASDKDENPPKGQFPEAVPLSAYADDNRGLEAQVDPQHNQVDRSKVVPDVDEVSESEPIAAIPERHATDLASTQSTPLNQHAHNDKPSGPVKANKPVSPQKRISLDAFKPEFWLAVYQQLDTGGLLQSTAANSVFTKREGQCLHFVLDESQSTLYDAAHQKRLAELLSEYFEQTVDVAITLGAIAGETPSQIIVRLQQERLQEARKAIEADPLVQQLQATFDATIIEDSIKAID